MGTSAINYETVTGGLSKIDQSLISEARQKLEIDRERMGAEHPETLSDMMHLAVLFSDADKSEEAEKLLADLLRIRIRISGSHDYEVQKVALKLGDVLQIRGNYASARVMHEGVLQVLSGVYGSDSDVATTAATHLAKTLDGLGDIERLREIQERIVENNSQNLGVAHLDTLRAVTNLAETMRKLGDFASARDLDLKVLNEAKGNCLDSHIAIRAQMNLLTDLTELKEWKIRANLIDDLRENVGNLPRGDPLRKQLQKTLTLMKPFLKAARER
jgi:hypothetical protein